MSEHDMDARDAGAHGAHRTGGKPSSHRARKPGRFEAQRSELGIDEDVRLRDLVLALLVDQVPGFVALGVFAALMVNETVTAPVAILGAISVATVSSMLLLVALRGSTGQSFGDRRVGVEYVDATTGAPVGMRRIMSANSERAAARGIRVKLAA